MLQGLLKTNYSVYIYTDVYMNMCMYMYIYLYMYSYIPLLMDVFLSWRRLAAQGSMARLAAHALCKGADEGRAHHGIPGTHLQ